MDYGKIFQMGFVLLFLVVSVIAAPQYLEADDQAEAPSDHRDKRHYGHGVTGPVHTFVKTDKDAHFKWGVRHHVGHHYAGK